MIQSLDRGIKVLEILERKKSAGVTEIAKEMSIDKSTAFRLLETLMKSSLVEQDPASEKYKLSAGILKFGNSFIKNSNITKTARPFLEQLSGITKESAHIRVDGTLRKKCVLAPGVLLKHPYELFADDPAFFLRLGYTRNLG